jgi:ribosomal protein S18 acetylase RimI-like enzyme
MQTRQIIIRRLTPADAKDYRRIRLLGLQESPEAFGSAYVDERKLSDLEFRRRLGLNPDKWTLGAFQGHRLVGVVTLIRNGGRKERHKAGLYGMYVVTKSRRRGVGRELLHTTLKIADTMPGLRQVFLSVVEENYAAVALYEAAQFKPFGREEDALLVKRKFYAELLLVRRVVRAQPIL